MACGLSPRHYQKQLGDDGFGIGGGGVKIRNQRNQRPFPLFGAYVFQGHGKTAAVH